MRAAEILRTARHTGIQLRVEGNDLVLEAAAAPSPGLLELLASHKSEIMALVRPTAGGWSGEDWQAFYEERAAIAEHDGGFQRLEAELVALEECVDRWLVTHPPAMAPRATCLHCGVVVEEGNSAVSIACTSQSLAKLHKTCAPRWLNNRKWEARRTIM